MNEATIAQTVMSLALLLIFLGFLIWGFKTGQFDEIEEAKYRMFEEYERGEALEERDGEGDE